jgi:hypothetical protein
LQCSCLVIVLTMMDPLMDLGELIHLHPCVFRIAKYRVHSLILKIC